MIWLFSSEILTTEFTYLPSHESVFYEFKVWFVFYTHCEIRGTILQSNDLNPLQDKGSLLEAKMPNARQLNFFSAWRNPSIGFRDSYSINL